MKHLKNFNTFKINENTASNIDEYMYVIMEVLPNGLKLSLTQEGKDKANEDGISENDFSDYFEDIQGNSEYMYFPNLGDAGLGLSEAPCITHGYYYNDNGELIDEGHNDSKVYYYSNYMISNFTDVMLNDGSVFFQKA